MSNNRITQQQKLENQRLIQMWMRRNSSGKVTINPNHVKVSSLKSSLEQNQNGNQSLSNQVTVTVTKKEGKNKTTLKSNLSSNRFVNKRHNPKEPLQIKTKIAKWSSPAISVKIEPASTTPDPVTKFEVEKTFSDSEPSITLKEIPKSLQLSNLAKSKLKAQNIVTKVSVPIEKSNLLNSKLIAQNTLTKTSVPMKTVEVDINNKNIHPINRKNVKKKLKDHPDIYDSLLDNYKYFLIPKLWSVTEFANDAHKECIIFSKPQVIEENEKLISVIQKSMIIDKSGTIHYSVHGLPVNTEGMILPSTLDSIKKLLSILHILDKLQVCKGIGDDLFMMKTDWLLKDICQFWRHRKCKLLLVKVDQCQICLDTRNILLEKEMVLKSRLMSTHCMDIKVEDDSDI